MSSPAQSSYQTYTGSCHCGLIKYTARLSLNAPSLTAPKSPTSQTQTQAQTQTSTSTVLTKCNCTICVKTNSILAEPQTGSFRLLSPPGGMDALSNYTFNSHQAHHRFCPTCGVRCFLNGTWEIEGGRSVEVLRINVATLDGRVQVPMGGDGDGEGERDGLGTGLNLRDVKIRYIGNRLEREAMGGLRDEPYDGGLW